MVVTQSLLPIIANGSRVCDIDGSPYLVHASGSVMNAIHARLPVRLLMAMARVRVRAACTAPNVGDESRL